VKRTARRDEPCLICFYLYVFRQDWGNEPRLIKRRIPEPSRWTTASPFRKIGRSIVIVFLL
jgi:hypothetical protein